MSADNWEACPRCVDNALTTFGERVKAHAARYGYIDAEQWVEELKTLTPPDLKDRDFQTFREDYEWWTEDGKLYGSWRGSCTTCGLTYSHQVGPVTFYSKGEDVK